MKFCLLVIPTKHLNTCKSFWPIFVKVGMRLFATNEVYDFCVDYSVAKFLKSKGMLEDALEITIDPNKIFDLAIHFGKLGITKVLFLSFPNIVHILVFVGARV
jgi:hypothetical protein